MLHRLGRHDARLMSDTMGYLQQEIIRKELNRRFDQPSLKLQLNNNAAAGTLIKEDRWG